MILIDVVLESIRVMVLLALVSHVWWLGRRRGFSAAPGWRLIQTGFALLLFGSTLDLTDNFEFLDRYVFVGDTPIQAILEKVVGYLFGFVALTTGLVRWAPSVEVQTTERKRRRAAEERGGKILEAVRDGVVGFDSAERITFANSAACAMLGETERGLVGVLLRDRLGVDGTLLSASTRTCTATFAPREGDRFPAEYMVSSLIGEGPSATGVLTFRDISERLSTEAAKEEAIAVVVHELRTPLTSIKGALDLLEDGVVVELPTKAAQLVRLSNRNAHVLMTLVDDILDAQKMSAERLELAVELVDLAEVARATVVAFKGYADAAGVVVTCCDSTDVPLIVAADGERIAQVLRNLLSNAVKFSPLGSEVEVRTALEGGTARVTVSDQGCGIPDKYRERIFQKFVQVDGSSTRARPGTGLGLSITKEIVTAHGGSLDFESEVGHGTKFHFTIPLKVARQAA